MVSKLNPQSRSVTVEWYERGETKGKEVELDMLVNLNPELFQDKQNYMPAPAAVAIPTVHQQNTTNLQRVSYFYFYITSVCYVILGTSRIPKNQEPSTIKRIPIMIEKQLYHCLFISIIYLWLPSVLFW
jgi:hypothetical protein